MLRAPYPIYRPFRNDRRGRTRPQAALRTAIDIACLNARINRPIVLVGLMGVGKSTVGRRLASVLGCGFVDADDAIEDAAQRTVAEIFAEFGEFLISAMEKGA